MKRANIWKRLIGVGGRLAVLTMVAALILGVVGCSCQPIKEIFNRYEMDRQDYDNGFFDVEPAMDDPILWPVEHEDLPFNTEEYDVFEENRFLSTESRPLSTFAADVDTASYANIRRQLSEGMMPLVDSVRIEEMLNYFRYDYNPPKEGEVLGIDLGLTDTPWNQETKLLRVGITAAESRPTAQQDIENNLVFLIDVSGSMDMPDKLPLVKRSFLFLVESLTENDTISIVTYASTDAVLLDGVNGEQKTEIMSAIEVLEPRGFTHGSAGIQTAYELAQKHFIKGGNNRVILATDGDLNLGVTSDGELTRLITEKRKSGVFLSVLGFGQGNLKDSKMEKLADNGNGQYSYIDSVQEARKVLYEEAGQNLVTVAKDVKIQVDFNSAKVKGYRLIGYENRALADEDFADDTKDGGELGAGHRMTALYEIVLPGSAQEIPETGSKYQKDEDDTSIGSSESDELLTVSVRYKDPDGDTSRLISESLTEDSYVKDLDDNTRLAAALAAFGMLLRESSYSGDASYEMVEDLLSGLETRDDYVNELVELVGTAKKLTPFSDK